MCMPRRPASCIQKTPFPVSPQGCSGLKSHIVRGRSWLWASHLVPRFCVTAPLASFSPRYYPWGRSTRNSLLRGVLAVLRPLSLQINVQICFSSSTKKNLLRFWLELLDWPKSLFRFFVPATEKPKQFSGQPNTFTLIAWLGENYVSLNYLDL